MKDREIGSKVFFQRINTGIIASSGNFTIFYTNFVLSLIYLAGTKS